MGHGYGPSSTEVNLLCFTSVMPICVFNEGRECPFTVFLYTGLFHASCSLRSIFFVIFLET